MMLTYREYKNLTEAINPYQQLKQTGLDLGRRGAMKLCGVVDMIVQMAANKDAMLRKVITYLKAAAKGEENETEMIAQLNNTYNVLVQAARQQQQPQQQQPMNPNV